MTESTGNGISTSTSGCHGECFNCGNSVPIAIWDDAALSGKIALFCGDCHEEPPETNLWESEDEEEEHHLVNIPELPTDEDWKVLNHYRNWDTEVLERYGCDSVKELRQKLDGSGTLGLTADEVLEEPEPEWEIVVNSFEDREAIKQAREEVRKRLD